MVVEVWGDLYVLVNAGMDFLAITLTASLLHRKFRVRRSLLAAFFGGVYALFALLSGIEGILGILLDLAAGAAVVLLAGKEKKESPKTACKTVAVYLLVNLTLGGIMTGLSVLLNRMGLPIGELAGEEEGGASVWLFSLLAGVSGLLTLKGGRFLGLSAKTKEVTVTVKVGGKTAVLRALVDSGNLLRDPISGKSVVVADRQVIAPLLPDWLKDRPAGENAFPVPPNAREAARVRLIPTETAGGKSLLCALIPEKLEISDGRNVYGADYLLAPADLGERENGYEAVIALQ